MSKGISHAAAVLEEPEEEIRCPRCGASAFNRYGKSPSGRQRYICLLCQRQFVQDSGPLNETARPRCPECGRPMHVYRRERGLVRYRCSGYPLCKRFVKITHEESNAV